MFGLKPWSDRQPKLYGLEVGLHEGNNRLDVRRQPFGLRRLTTAGSGLQLNARPTFLRGVAHHSYYPLTCTHPTDPAWYHGHIRRMKEIGFNWLRFHTSVPLEPYLEAAAVQLDAVPDAFDPTVEVVSSYKQVCRQATVFEAWRTARRATMSGQRT